MTDHRERLDSCPFCGGTRIGLHHDLCPSPSGEDVYHEAVAECSSCEILGPRVAVPDTPNIDGWREARLQAIAAWNRRTPSQSPDGYEVQWRPRGSDTWDGGSAGVYRTPEIAAEVVQEFTAEGHETRVRPIAYLDGASSQSREELEEAFEKYLAGQGITTNVGYLRLWANALTRIALGEREP